MHENKSLTHLECLLTLKGSNDDLVFPYIISAFAPWSSDWVSFISAFASWSSDWVSFSSKWCSSTVSCNASNWNKLKCANTMNNFYSILFYNYCVQICRFWGSTLFIDRTNYPSLTSSEPMSKTKNALKRKGIGKREYTILSCH